tara:strand:+ start:26 stop:646 length:621 start_codon:yes stop_codon:yes gene_type:complete
MALVLNGSSNTIGGVAVGGLPDGIVDTDMLAANAVKLAKLGSTTGKNGPILQVVSVSKTDAFSSTSTSTAQDVTGLTINITPTSSSSKLFIQVHISVTAGSSYGGHALLLAKVDSGTTTYPFRGNATGSSTRATFPVSNQGNTGYPDVAAGSFLDTAGSTNAITYKIQHIDESTNNTIYINRETHGTGGAGTCIGTSGITVMEVAA